VESSCVVVDYIHRDESGCSDLPRRRLPCEGCVYPAASSIDDVGRRVIRLPRATLACDLVGD
ncbi:MAG TPA: hypothetical protein VKA77_07755, partial [Mycobacterium sp.]|nr:hypothetical protein [Mycobacterium sp.]